MAEQETPQESAQEAAQEVIEPKSIVRHADELGSIEEATPEGETPRKLEKIPPADGPVSWFAGHHVAANLLMAFVLLLGVLALGQIVVEVFPEFTVDLVTVSVAYPGASPAETEEGVVVRIEEAIASIEGIERINGTAAEGAGAVTIELEDDADDRVVDDIKSAVDRIDTFPEETEEPVVSEVMSRRQVLSVAVHGQADRKSLLSIAEHLRDDLTATDDVSQVEVRGVPPKEIAIEVSEHSLRQYGLTFSQVADAVRGASLDLPGGKVKTAGGEVQLRTEGQAYTAAEFADITVLTRGDGTEIRVGDLGRVVDDFAENDVSARFDGTDAVLVQVYRTGDEGALQVAEEVHRQVEDLQMSLPLGVEVDVWQDTSIILRQRISLLLENARLGLLLVFISLALFLDLRLAFWTTMGIPISFLGGLALLPHWDVSINMISLFAFIVSLGIVVDDAIVVGENIYAKMEEGLPPLKAAVEGAKEMTGPVTFAVLTSVAAFLPLVFVSGIMGTVMRVIPLVVIAVLLLSLIESLLILPAHLSGRGTPAILKPLLWILSPITRLLEALRTRTTLAMERFIRGPYRRFLNLALSWRYLTAAAAAVVLMVTISIVASGKIKFTLMPNVDGDDLTAYLEMPQGIPVEQTERIVRRMETAMMEIGAEIEAELGLEDSVVEHVGTTLGEQPSTGGSGPVNLGATSGSGSHLAEIKVELMDGERRGIESAEIMNRWRERIGQVPGATSLTFQSSIFRAGDAVSLQLSHRDFDTLLAATERFKEMIAEYPGVKDITDSFVPGKEELEIDITAEGRAAGLTRGMLARQVRQGFFGEEAQRIQRGRDEIKVMVRYPETERTSRGDIEQMRVRLPDGTEVPFSAVAEVREGRGFATISRVDRRRVVTVSADVDSRVANASEINSDIQQRLLPVLQADFPGLMSGFEGEAKEQAESLASMKRNFAVALLMIFSLLAIPFRSYSQPLIIMSVIPFGFVGAVTGHLMMGLDLSLLSFFGMVALTGVVVNDSLIMIDLINRERRAGVPLGKAIRESGEKRFRPIILTTLTTFFGLTPMILETSLQAKFLIPMAISLGFGVLSATVITLLLVPIIYRILEDLHQLFDSTTVRVRERRERRRRRTETPEPQHEPQPEPA